MIWINVVRCVHDSSFRKIFSSVLCTITVSIFSYIYRLWWPLIALKRIVVGVVEFSALNVHHTFYVGTLGSVRGQSETVLHKKNSSSQGHLPYVSSFQLYFHRPRHLSRASVVTWSYPLDCATCRYVNKRWIGATATTTVW